MTFFRYDLDGKILSEHALCLLAFSVVVVVVIVTNKYKKETVPDSQMNL